MLGALVVAGSNLGWIEVGFSGGGLGWGWGWLGTFGWAAIRPSKDMTGKKEAAIRPFCWQTFSLKIVQGNSASHSLSCLKLSV